MADLFQTIIQTNVPQTIRSDRVALIAATRKVVGGRARYIKTMIRREVVRAGLGARLANAIGSFTRDTSDGIEAQIFSKGKVRHDYGSETVTVDLLAIFQSDADITAREKTFMAIPLPAAGRGPRGRKARVSDFPAGSLIAKIRGDAGVLVSRTDPETPLFILLAKVHRTKRLDFARVRKYASVDLTARIVQEWVKHRPHLSLQLVA